jgi:hypothetical protein
MMEEKNCWYLPFVRICDITLIFRSESGVFFFAFCYIFVTCEIEREREGEKKN